MKVSTICKQCGATISSKTKNDFVHQVRRHFAAEHPEINKELRVAWQASYEKVVAARLEYRELALKYGLVPFVPVP